MAAAAAEAGVRAASTTQLPPSYLPLPQFISAVSSSVKMLHNTSLLGQPLQQQQPVHAQAQLLQSDAATYKQLEELHLQLCCC
jgi:uncharacterized protein involved in exopolysaccharide biosynthesis